VGDLKALIFDVDGTLYLSGEQNFTNLLELLIGGVDSSR